jgi:hypothetical protein
MQGMDSRWRDPASAGNGLLKMAMGVGDDPYVDGTTTFEM